MRPLILFDRTSGFGPGDITVRKVETTGSHPVMWEVPKEWRMHGSSNIGQAHVFETQPVTVLARDTAGNDAVAVREYGNGRIVGFHHGGNWGMEYYGAEVNNLNAREARRLFVDGVRWSWGCAPQREPQRGSSPPLVLLPPHLLQLGPDGRRDLLARLGVGGNAELADSGQRRERRRALPEPALDVW